MRVVYAACMKIICSIDCLEQQNTFTRLENKSTLRSRKSTLRDAHVSTAQDVRSAIVQK